MAKSIELTYEKAVELLDRAVEEKGEGYIYEPAPTGDYLDRECAYFHGEKPGCIVGHALAYVGLEPADLRDRENSWDQKSNLNTLASPETLKEYGVLKASDTTVTLLAVAQANQDDGMAWGAAVERAKARTR